MSTSTVNINDPRVQYSGQWYVGTGAESNLHTEEYGAEVSFTFIGTCLLNPCVHPWLNIFGISQERP